MTSRNMLLACCLAALACAAHAAPTVDDYASYEIRAADIPADAPRFEQHAVRERFTGKPAEPDVRSHPRSRRFRTMIRYGASEGPNFAGHYTIVFWGCGSGCVELAIVDARSGKVFHPANLRLLDNFNVAYEELAKEGERLIQFRRDSRLIVVYGSINDVPAWRGIAYFTWEHERLRRIRFVPKPIP